MGSEPSRPVQQSLEVLNTGRPKDNPDGKPPTTNTRRSVESAHALMETAFPECTTLYECWQRGARVSAGRPCLGKRSRAAPTDPAGPYTWQSFATVDKRITDFGAGLLQFGAAAGDHIGIYAINRPEWVVAEYGGYSQSMLNIALYDTLGAEAVQYILNQAQIALVVCTKDKVAKLLDAASDAPTLARIVQMDGDIDPAQRDLAAAKNITMRTFAEVEADGAAHPVPANPPKKNSLATIMYTSGTTGLPKGVMLTHQNIVAASASAASRTIGIQFTPEDSYISYLPLAHIFERVVQVTVLTYGGACGFYDGDVLKLVDDIQVLKPTIFPSVPRLFNRIFDKVMQGLAQKGSVAQSLFHWVYESKKAAIQSNGAPTHIAENIVFGAVKERLGGRVRLMITGSAPISAEVFNFLQICFCCPVLNGYGLTETSAGTTIMRSTDFTYSAGPPIPAVEIMLEEVAEMSYFAANNEGEICVRGPCVFGGYYKNEVQTREALDSEGWFHTGDIGRWNQNGTLAIIDRKKNIFKLAQGEYVAAEHLENIFTRNPFVQQLFVYGDSLQAYLVAIVVPDPDTLMPWAKQAGIEGDFATVCANPEVSKKLLTEINGTGKECKLRGFEFIKMIHVESTPFNVENGNLTPTFKLQRVNLKKNYIGVITEMYARIATLDVTK